MSLIAELAFSKFASKPGWTPQSRLDPLELESEGSRGREPLHGPQLQPKPSRQIKRPNRLASRTDRDVLSAVDLAQIGPAASALKPSSIQLEGGHLIESHSVRSSSAFSKSDASTILPELDRLSNDARCGWSDSGIDLIWNGVGVKPEVSRIVGSLETLTLSTCSFKWKQLVDLAPEEKILLEKQKLHRDHQITLEHIEVDADLLVDLRNHVRRTKQATMSVALGEFLKLPYPQHGIQTFARSLIFCFSSSGSKFQRARTRPEMIVWRSLKRLPPLIAPGWIVTGAVVVVVPQS